MKLKEIAAALDGTLVGDGDATVERPAHPAEAGPGDLALAIEPGALKLLATTRARVALVAANMTVPETLAGYVAVRRPRYALAALTRLFDRPALPPPGVHPSAVVEPGAVLGDQTAVGALAWIGARARIGARSVIMPQASIGAGASIGADCVIHSGVRIGAGVEIGARAIIHPNAVIGADGFGYATPEPGSVETARARISDKVTATNTAIVKIHSLGTVIIGDDVEIGANTTVDRGTIAATRIGSGTKIDNLVQVAHNVTIGRNCLIVAQVGLSGSVKVGERAVIAGQAEVADRVTIGDDAIVMAAAAVGRDVLPREMVIGLPAVPRERFLEQVLNVARLKMLRATVAEMQQRLARLEGAAAKQTERKPPNHERQVMSDIASDVFDIIARCGRVERAAVLPDASLADLKIESLSVVEIIFALEEKFGIEIPFEANQQVVKFETVADVVKAVEGLVAAKRASA